MLGPLFVFSLLAFICVGALVRPHIGVIGYYGFALLNPQWNWRWSIPTDFQYQKFIAGATLMGFLFSGLAGNRLQGNVRTACLLLVAFLGLAYLSAQSTINQAATDHYMSYLWKLVLMAVLAVILLDTPKKIIACMGVIVLAQGYNAYQINLQYFADGFSRYAVMTTWGGGSQGNNNTYSILTVPLMAVSAAFAVYAPKWWQKAGAFGIFVLQAHQLMLLESRGAMMGAIAMVGIFTWLVPKSKLSLGWIGLAGMAVAVLAGPPVIEEFTSSFATGEELDSSAESRYKLWEAGWAITKDYPLLGAGPNAGSNLVPRYYPGGLDTQVKALHNLFFEISTGCGVPAVLAYLGFFIVPWTAAFRIIRQERREPTDDWAACSSLAVVSGLFGYWVASMFSSGALLESSYVCASIGLATTSVLAQTRCHDDDSSIRLRNATVEANDSLGEIWNPHS